MNLSTKKKMTMKKRPSFVSIKQRIVAIFTVAVMLLQICLPTVVWAATVLSNESITMAMASPTFQKSTSNAFLYEQASYDDASYVGSQNITTFRQQLVAAKTNLGKPTFIPIGSDITIFIPTYPTGKLIGDAYVQNRYIRQQVFDLLGRHLIYANVSDTSEVAQIDKLYEAAFAFAKANPTINFGTNLSAATLANLTTDMIWPEVRIINNESVVVPILYLTTSTINENKVSKNLTEFLGPVANLGSITLDHAELTLGANTIVKTAGNLTADKDSLILSGGDINLVVGGTLNLIGSKITGVKDVKILANEINVKTVLVPFKDRYGSGTKLGSIASISSATSNISLASTGSINFEGARVDASNGSLTITAAQNISIQPLFTSYQGQYVNGHWQVSASSLDVIGSRLSAQDKITLIAGGGIEIRASELISTQGGIELLAQQGIYIVDELTQEQIQRVDRKGKTTGQSSEFRTEAVRSILKAGKGVLLNSESGDVTLKATEITSVTGTEVTAKNGKVHLLMTKELEEFHLQTVRKGTWTIKTRTEDVIHENNIQNAIVGGLQVQAKYGINVEYTGKEGATLKEQIEEYRKMPEMKWMADLYDQSVTAGGQSVNWQVMEEVHQELKKTKRNLSPAAMAIIAICVAVVTAGAGVGMVGAIQAAVFNATVGIIGATAATALAAAMAAGAVALTTQATQSLAAGNNVRETVNAMDSDESLRSLAIAMATAGVMEHADIDMFTTAAGSENLAVSLSGQAAQAVVDSTVRAGISVSIDGGGSDEYLNAFKRNLATHAINTIGQKLANNIATADSLAKATQYISNAALGCLTEGLTAKLSEQDAKDACASGAGGAVIAVGLADILEQKTKNLIATTVSEGQVSQPSADLSATLSFLNANRVDISRLLAGLAALAVHGDVNAASNGAGVIGTAQEMRIMRTVGLGQVINAMGMANCGNASLNQCSHQVAIDEFRNGLIEQGKYSVQEIDAKINYLKTQTTFFEDMGAFNAVLLETQGSLEGLTQVSRSYPDSNNVPIMDSNGVQEVLVTGDKWSVMRSSLYGIGETIGVAADTTDAIVQDGVKALLEKPYGAPLRWGFGKIAEAAKKYPEITAVLNKPEELKEALGTGSAAVLMGDKYAATKLFIDSDPSTLPAYNNEPHKSISHVASGYSWLVGVVGAGALVYAAKTMSFTRFTTDGQKLNNGEEDFYKTEKALEFTDLSRLELAGFLAKNKIPLKDGWDANRLYDEVLSKPKGQRRPPSDYLPAEYIAASLKQFDSGVVRVTNRGSVVNGTFNSGNELFSLPYSEWERIKIEAGGDINKISTKLGFTTPINPAELMIIKINRADIATLKVPTGNEFPSNPNGGANRLWAPGSKTIEGVSEAVFQISGPVNVTELFL